MMMPLADLEARRQYARTYYLKNSGVIKARAAGHHIAFRDKYLEGMKRRRANLTVAQQEAEKQRHAKIRKERPAAVRSAHLKSKYGISLEEFEVMKAAQGGRCAICGTEHETLVRGLGVDHDHGTGGVRGLLCGNCNVALGGFKDSPALLRKAAEYLESVK